MIDIGKTILAINLNAEFRITDENFNTIEWLNGTTSISKSDIQAKQAELQTAYDAKEYQRDRSVAYAEIKDEQQAAIDKKASGKAKLKELGLDDAEIKALIGI